MTSSGVATVNPSMSSIIETAFRKAGIVRDDETPDGNAVAVAKILLNEMCKTWQAQNIRVWTLEEAILFLQPDQARYQLGLTSSDHMSDAYDYLQTTLSSAAASGATSITLTAATPLAVSDNIGIELDSGTVQWTTVSSISSLTIGLGAALTGAAASGNTVVAYTSKIIRPLKIPRAAVIMLGSTVTETPLIVNSRQEYMDMPNKSNTGVPSTLFYSPKIPLGEIFVWPTPDSADMAVRFTYQRPIYDFVSSSDTADFPQEWHEALTTGLALRLAGTYQAPVKTIEFLGKMYDTLVQVLVSWDREPESIFMSPDMD